MLHAYRALRGVLGCTWTVDYDQTTNIGFLTSPLVPQTGCVPSREQPAANRGRVFPFPFSIIGDLDLDFILPNYSQHRRFESGIHDFDNFKWLMAVSALPVLLLPVAPLVESQMTEDTDWSIQVLYGKLKRSQDSAAVVVNLSGAPEGSLRK